MSLGRALQRPNLEYPKEKKRGGLANIRRGADSGISMLQEKLNTEGTFRSVQSNGKDLERTREVG